MKRVILSVAALLSWGCSDNPVSLPVAKLKVSESGAFARGPMGVIVMLKSGNPREVAKAHGITPKWTYKLIRGFAAVLSQPVIEALKHNPNVKSVTPDGVLSATTVPANLDRINQRTTALDGLYSAENTGSGVTVYIPDSGIRLTHSEFQGRATLGYDFIGGDGSDCTSHGTLVAGIVGGVNVGVAKQVSLVALKVFGCSSDTETSIVIAALDWIAANAVRPAVVNLSLRGSADPVFDSAVASLVTMGIPVVVAAGNDNANACNYSPAREPSVITVGGSTMITSKGKLVDTRYDMSNYGSCLDIFAPSNAVSAWASGDSVTASGTGTSVSAPHVTGVAAIVLSANPLFSPAQVDSAVKARSTKGVITSSLSTADDLVYSLGDVGPEPCGRHC